MFSFLMLSLGCTGDTDPPPPPDDSATRTTVVDSEDTGQAVGVISVTLGTQMVTSASFTGVFDSELTLSFHCVGEADTQVPEEHLWTAEGPAKTHAWPLRGLLAETTYTCVGSSVEGAVSVDPVTFTTEALPDALLAHTVTLDTWEPSAENGWTLIDLFTHVTSTDVKTFLAVLDMEARIRWYWEVPENEGIIAFDWNSDAGAFWIGGGHIRTVTPRVIDLDGNVLYETSTEANHDSHWHDDSAYGLILGPAGFCIQERLWADDSEQYLICANELGYDGQLQGANSFDVVEEDDGKVYIYATLTDAGQVLKIDRDERSLVWTFGSSGDFSGVAPFSWLHDVHWVDCEYDVCLFYYDNGDQTAGSQAILWGLDETQGVATEIRSWRQSGWYESTLGGVQILDGGHWLIGRGHNEIENKESPDTTVVEVDTDGQVVWQISITPSDHATYRARRVGPCELFSHVGYCPEGLR